MEKFLGIDVGGTNVKMALVNLNGSISSIKKFPTASLGKNNDFVASFTDVISTRLKKHPTVTRVGIGIPGTLSKDRNTIFEVPAIPQLNGVNLMESLKKELPQINFNLENDANAAALGEYYFPRDKIKLPANFIFITMGTGIGGAAIINGAIFGGGDGNGMEVGHVFSRNSTLLENNIGKRGIISLAKTYLLESEDESNLDPELLTSSDLVSAAENGNRLAMEVFDTVGQILGEALVSVIRILDVKTIIIGGGLSSSFNFISHSLNKTIHAHLTPYYLKDLLIKRATLANQAGIIGAASLCFQMDPLLKVK
ncbi:MAG: ROK family protein [Bacteroidota bacterium]|nr:ROK family protein [Bacteroidota bacterium]